MLQRANWTCLNGPWRFSFDLERRYTVPADVSHWPLVIEVPYPPESAASGIADTSFHAVCWYQRDFELKPSDKRAILHFGAVDYLAKVWVNGHFVTSHEGGHTPFRADITEALDPSGRQTVTVFAEDDPQDLAKPRGKQDWQLKPHSIWYPRTSGIWQTVWLEQVSQTYIDRVRWTPHVEGFALTFEAHIGGTPIDELAIELTLSHGARVLAHDVYHVVSNTVDRRIILSDPGIDDYRNELLWSPERPTLLDAEIRLIWGGAVIDEVRSYTALRTVTISRDRFMLNGRPYTLRLVLDQGYWPHTLLASPDDDALRRDVELAKAMGFNGVRKHQKIEDPRYLYWADRLGLLVWEEMPSAYRFTDTAIRRMVREWSEAIDRDWSHPCIVVWVPFNESWGVPELPTLQQHRHAVEGLYHLTKTLDPTRPVVGNDGWEAGATDIIGIHDYDPNAEHIEQRYGRDADTTQLFDRRRPGGRMLTLDGYPHIGQPIIMTEFGGIAYVGPDRIAPTADNEALRLWGYSQASSDEEFYARYRSLVLAVVDAPLFSGFCYTQFADTFQEINGLLYADRTPKIPLELIADVTRHSRTYIPGAA
ncbi:MAG TPA: glycoside hydrolase family 2 TIM barrel-domain containing protein [Casimicrobiaceae bacterium]|nr:glycoside hydrolase family 2 TIM barrel-domain containing protein [Casimicrobiaceae bacterium]